MPEGKILKAEETYEIIPEENTSGAGHNLVHVSGGAVYLSHNSRDVRNNPSNIVEPNDRVSIGNYRESAVFAYAPEGATIRVSERGFSLNFLPRRITENPADASTREQDYDYDMKQKDIATGGKVSLSFGISNDEPRIMDSVSLSPLNSLDVTHRLEVAVEDGSGQIIKTVYGNYPWNSPLQFTPGIHVPLDGRVVVFTEQQSGSQTTVNVSVGHRGVR